MECGSCKKCGGFCYDTLTACISLLDVATDIIVLLQFYNNGRMMFFWASLIILIIAQLSSILAFWGRHHRRNSPLLSVLLFFLLIPFAPFLSCLFYIVADAQRYKYLIANSCCLSALICNNPYTTYVDDNHSELQQWMQMKLYKHIGYCIESIFEAFPQSILQLISIIYYGDDISILVIISITLSIISVCSKSFAFCVAVSTDTKSIVFTWLCVTTDLISIFCTACIIFYGLRHADLHEPFRNLQIFFCYKLVICVIPVALIGSLGVNLYCTAHYISYSMHHHNSWLHIIVYCVTVTLFIQLIWIVVLCLAVMSLEVLCLIWFALVFIEIGLNHRLSSSSKYARRFYLRLTKWIKSAQTIKCDATKTCIPRDSLRVIRVFAINKILLQSASQISSLKTQWHRNGKDDKLLAFVHRINASPSELATIYHDLRWSDFRDNTDNRNFSQFVRNFWVYNYGKLWRKYRDQLNEPTHKIKHRIGFIVSSVMTFVLLPLYFVSRLINILFPALIVLYLYCKYDIVFWYSYIDPFQVTVLLFYALFLSLSFAVLLFSGIVSEEYYAWHILPISKRLYTPKNYHDTELKFEEIVDYYDGIVYVPIITNLLQSRFGIDIGKVIMHYYHSIIVRPEEEMSCESYTDLDDDDDEGDDTRIDIHDHDEESITKGETNSLLPSTPTCT